MLNVAVTGASGFIGGYVLEALSEAGHLPIGIGRSDMRTSVGRYHQSDYSKKSFREILTGVDAVVHLAGRRMTREDDPMDLGPFIGPNVDVVRALANAACETGVKRIVLASTIAIYDPTCETPYRESGPARPQNAYALSKLMAEHYLAMLTKGAPFSSVSLRLSAIYGAGEKGTPALMSFINQARAGKTLNIKGDPNYQIDELYVLDAARAILRAVEETSAEGVLNIGSGMGSKLLQIAETANEVFENAGNLVITGAAASEQKDRFMSIDRASRALGFQQSYNLQDGMLDFKRVLNFHAQPDDGPN